MDIKLLGRLPLGTVIATLPDRAKRSYRCTTTTSADAEGMVKCSGETIVDSTSPFNGTVTPKIDDKDGAVFVMRIK